MSSASYFRLWGHRAVSEITRRDIRDLIDGIADRGSPVMALRIHAYVHRFFRWCVGRDIVEATRRPTTQRSAVRRGVIAFCRTMNLVAIWSGAGQLGWPFGDAIRLLILTGARREGDWSAQMVRDCGRHNQLEGERTKNGEPHTLPLSTAATIVLQRTPRIANSERVFTTNGKTPVSGWSRAKTKLDEISGLITGGFTISGARWRPAFSELERAFKLSRPCLVTSRAHVREWSASISVTHSMLRSVLHSMRGALMSRLLWGKALE